MPLDPSRGLLDQREMSSTLITTQAGSAAAGSEGVSEGATGNPRQGQAEPDPAARQPAAADAAVRDRLQQRPEGRLRRIGAGRQPENFRCAFNKSPGALNKAES